MNHHNLFIISVMILMSTTIFGKPSVNLRMNVDHFDIETRIMSVDVQVSYDQAGSLNLASQNYRFYYDSQLLTLKHDQSSDLLDSRYGSLKWENMQSNIDASSVGDLEFDDNLGFANFSLALVDNVNGGISLSKETGWISVARLTFEVQEGADLYQIVWGRDDMTARYATAFVEIGEWKAENLVELIDVNTFGDVAIEKVELLELESIKYSIGPNPTADFVDVNLSTGLELDAVVLLQDMRGQTFIRQPLLAGERTSRIDVTDLGSASYLLRVVADNETHHSATIAVTR